jgi:hypothetical protein
VGINANALEMERANERRSVVYLPMLLVYNSSVTNSYTRRQPTKNAHGNMLGYAKPPPNLQLLSVTSVTSVAIFMSQIKMLWALLANSLRQG